MNSKNVKHFIIVKYYNRNINHMENDNFIKFWNMMSKEKNENSNFDEYKESFKTSLRSILYNIRYLKI